MDDTQFTNLLAEINDLPTFLAGYDSDVSNFLNGTEATCPHFLEVISALSNDEAYSAAYSLAWTGQGSAYGYLTDFLYIIFAIQRNSQILSATKASYYSTNDSVAEQDSAYYSGEAAKLISFIQGKSPTQGVLI